MAHWDGLPDGHTRATTVDTAGPGRLTAAIEPATEPLTALLTRRHTDLSVAVRPLADYVRAATSHSERAESR